MPVFSGKRPCPTALEARDVPGAPVEEATGTKRSGEFERRSEQDSYQHLYIIDVCTVFILFVQCCTY